jgi:hypothetical protein
MRWLLALCALSACVKAPDVVITDRRTALEQQAQGSFRGLEEELEQAGLVPRPAPLTAAQLAQAGVTREAETEDADGLPDALRADTLLVQRCVGEASDGTLVLTVGTCTGAMDVPQVTRMIERVNRNRRQLWTWLGTREPKKTPGEIQATWREVHLAGVICGGQVQKDDGAWDVKRC